MDVIILFTTIFITLYFYFTRHFNHWKKKNVPFFKPIPFVGNLGDCLMLRKSMAETFANIYNKTEGSYSGFFLLDKPCLLIRDTKIIQNILVRDFHIFNNRYVMSNKRDDPVGSQGLFFMRNPEWKQVRSKISPIYTSAKLKSMAKLMETVCNQMDIYLKESLSKNNIINVRSLCIKFLVNIVSSTAFGDPENCFAENGKTYLKQVERMIDWDNIITSFRMRSYFVAHKLVDLFGMKLFHPQSVKFLKNNFWKSITKRANTKLKKNDLIDFLMQLKHDESFQMDDDVLASQSVIFFIAGTDTTSGGISFALFELAQNQDIQTRVRKEVLEIFEKFGCISYDSLKEMQYLDMVIKETLRKYPSFPFLDRYNNTQYQIPDTDLVLEENTAVFMSIYGLHHDPKHYPDPEKFDPERFSPENEHNIDSFAYMPFGQGPRICIGQRFALIVMKFALASILKSYIVARSAQFTKNVRFHPQGLTLATADGIFLEFQEI